MKKLRLLLFEDCNRNCIGCCNKDWDLASLPIETDFSSYDKIMLTGGEPMLKPRLVFDVIKKIRAQNPKTKIYLYTAKTTDVITLVTILSYLDGITITLHGPLDFRLFILFIIYLNRHYKSTEIYQNKSLRLNIFKAAHVNVQSLLNELPSEWIVRPDMRWIKNCPLPEDEVFKKYK